MSIWGRRDSEPPAEGTHESQSPARAQQARATGEPEPEPQAGPGAQAEPLAQAGPEDQAGEPAPAFWRTQGETPAPLGHSPADAPPLADPPPPAHGDMPDAPPAPAGGQAAPAPDDMVVLDGTPPQAVPAAAADVPAGAPISPTGISPQRWSEILVTFVDDPRGSVKMAADAVDEAIGEFVSSVRARQRALDSSWHGAGTDTEQLRTALRDYRRFWHQVQQPDPAGKTGA